MSAPSESKKINVKSVGRKVEVYDLSLPYVLAMRKDPEYDTIDRALSDATDMSEDEISKIRYRDGVMIYEAIVGLTFPEVPSGEDTGSEKK